MARNLSKVYDVIMRIMDRYRMREQSNGKMNKLREFKIGDIVMRFRTTGSRTTDKLIGVKELKEGP